MYSDFAGPATLSAAVLAAAGAGCAAGAALALWGLGQLKEQGAAARSATSCWWSSVAGALGGAVALLGTARAGSWWLLPALLTWSYALAAAAVCDAQTQRVPTALVRQAGAAVVVLTAAAAALTGLWRWSIVALAVAAGAGALMALCWRFFGLGYGDVRLAILGGLGLVSPTHLGALVGCAAFIVIVPVHAVVVLARGGNRKTLFPFGPAIAAAFALAVAV